VDLELRGVTWQGPAIDDDKVLDDLPAELAAILTQLNGFVLFGGLLHFRGAVTEPAWHSLRRAWRDDALAIPALYGLASDVGIPFAQDCVGDQFLLRQGIVWTLSGETGELRSTSVSLVEFIAAAGADPDRTLKPAPLVRFRRDGGDLVPGRLLSVYPPFCTKESAAGVAIKDVPCDELIQFHADFARQTAAIEDGGRVRITVTD
jgi:hypothetical protein